MLPTSRLVINFFNALIFHLQLGLHHRHGGLDREGSGALEFDADPYADETCACASQRTFESLRLGAKNEKSNRQSASMSKFSMPCVMLRRAFPLAC